MPTHEQMKSFQVLRHYNTEAWQDSDHIGMHGSYNSTDEEV